MGTKPREFKTPKKPQGAKVRSFGHYWARAHYASPDELAARIPELHPLRNKMIAVFGLGCLGAPSVLEFARAGIGCMRLVDFDTVDPATTVRWPIGFTAGGHKKVSVLHEFIRRNYPYTTTEPFDFRLGGVRPPQSGAPSDQEQIATIVAGVDLIYDSTAELGVQHFLTSYAWQNGMTYVGLSGTLGGWGGKVFRIRPGTGCGCWFCYRLFCEEGTIPEPACAPNDHGTVQPTGCADPTFTGAGFDMLHFALAGVRLVVSTLCEGSPRGYPPAGCDVIHIRLRDDDGSFVTPHYETYNITPHPECHHSHAEQK